MISFNFDILNASILKTLETNIVKNVSKKAFYQIKKNG